MDNRLVLKTQPYRKVEVKQVLILIVMDNRLVLNLMTTEACLLDSLNPYCNGQPTSTFNYSNSAVLFVKS